MLSKLFIYCGTLHDNIPTKTNSVLYEIKPLTDRILVYCVCLKKKDINETFFFAQDKRNAHTYTQKQILTICRLQSKSLQIVAKVCTQKITSI